MFIYFFAPHFIMIDAFIIWCVSFTAEF